LPSCPTYTTHSDLVGLAANWIGFGWTGFGWIGSVISGIWIGLELIGLEAPGAPMVYTQFGKVGLHCSAANPRYGVFLAEFLGKKRDALKVSIMANPSITCKNHSLTFNHGFNNHPVFRR
jgi:hypothetical protein